MTAEEFLELYKEHGGNPEGFAKVDAGVWVADDKAQQKIDVLKKDDAELYFAVNLSRSGSYWDGYEYDEPGCIRVWPVTKTVTDWAYKDPAQ